MGKQRKLGLVLLGCLGLWVSGCENPFFVRKPEEPKGSPSRWEPAHTPYQLMDNFSESIAERDPEKFRRCLVDTSYSVKRFLFIPDPGVLESHPFTFANWSLEKEETVIRQAFLLAPRDSLCRLVFPETVRELIAPDTAVIIRQYRLDIRHTQAGLPVRYEGQMTLRLAEDRRGEWVVYRWEDRGIVPGEASWSFLKASLGG